MKTIQQTYHIQASPADVWRALTNAKDIENWSAGPARMNDQVGTEFSLWSGNIWGKNIKVVPQKQLIQEWYSVEDKPWDKPSVVNFMLCAEKNGTQVELLQTDVPDEYAKGISDGWREYYLGPLKDYIEQ